MTKAVLIRFLKGFVAGGLSQTILIINAGISIKNLAEAKAVGFVLISGFLTGGLLAIQKMLAWKDESQQ